MRRVLPSIGALAGVTGAAAALNRGLRATSGIPINHLGGTRIPWKWRGYDIFVTQAGEGTPLLLVHGISAGASSFEFRKIFRLLTQTHRVIAFDFLGCGLSEMPPLEYTTETFVEQIVDALDAFAGEPCVVVGSSCGAAFAIEAASRVGSRVRALAAICPTGADGVLDGATPLPQRAAGALLRAPIAGETLFNTIASTRAIRQFLERRIYAQPSAVTPDVVSHYYAVAHQPGARYVVASFLRGALSSAVARDLPFVEAPFLLLWGEEASSLNPAANATEFERLAKQARVAFIPEAGLLPHEERPDAVVGVLEAFLDDAGAVGIVG